VPWGASAVAGWQSRRAAFRLVAVLAIVVLGGAAGCDWWLRITHVSGTVRVDGKPAGGLQVVFEPVDRSRPRAMARTRADGSFGLGRQGPGDRDGAAAGDYVVKVMSDSDGGEGLAIPARYNVRSDLRFTVVPGRTNVFDVDISTKP
jgi:hypothetical protein